MPISRVGPTWADIGVGAPSRCIPDPPVAPHCIRHYTSNPFSLVAEEGDPAGTKAVQRHSRYQLMHHMDFEVT